jgi:hypothetical protein
MLANIFLENAQLPGLGLPLLDLFNLKIADKNFMPHGKQKLIFIPWHERII